MTRNPSIDYAAAHREYVFGEPPISLTDLAAKMECSRAALAARAAGQEGEMSWYEEREEFRRRLGDKTLTALADKWASFETANREKRMETANAALDAFIKDLAEGKVKIQSKDAVEWIRLMREEFADVRNAGRQPDVVDGQAVEMSTETALDAIKEIEHLLGTGKNAEPEPAT